MNRELRELRDAYYDAERLASRIGVIGFGTARVIDGDGKTAQLVVFTNALTTAGDEYYARKIIQGVGPANAGAPTNANGMKYGTSTTAVTKSGAAAALVAYVSASNTTFESTPTAHPIVASAGGDTGWNVTYKVTVAAGTATSATINEAVIVNDAGTNATSTATNTYARAVITTVNKTGTDALAITWTHKILGAL